MAVMMILKAGVSVLVVPGACPGVVMSPTALLICCCCAHGDFDVICVYKLKSGGKQTTQEYGMNIIGL